MKVMTLSARIPPPWFWSPACIRQYAAKFTKGTKKYPTNIMRKLSNFEQKVNTEEKMKWIAVSRVISITKTRTTVVTIAALMPNPVIKFDSRKMRRMAETELGKISGLAKITEI